MATYQIGNTVRNKIVKLQRNSKFYFCGYEHSQFCDPHLNYIY